jgi:hypothetical protein
MKIEARGWERLWSIDLGRGLPRISPRQVKTLSGSVYGNEDPLRGKVQSFQRPVAETESAKLVSGSFQMHPLNQSKY